MFERYTEKARRVIFFARYEASQFGSPYIETEHLLLGLLRENEALTNRFVRSPASLESIREQIEANTTIREKVPTSVDLPLSNECKRVMAYAAEEAERLGHKHIGAEHLLLGLLREKGTFAEALLKERGMKLEDVRKELVQDPKQDSPGGFFAETRVTGLLTDLVGAAAQGQSTAITGRDLEIDALIEVLVSSGGSNVVLIGERGVGKAAIIEGLAQRIASLSAPEPLLDYKVFAIEYSQLSVALRYPQLHAGLNAYLRTLAADCHVLVFTGELRPIDDLVPWVGPISKEAESPIPSGKLHFVASATANEYQKLAQSKPWIKRIFQPIYVRPLSEAETLTVLRNSMPELVRTHGIQYSEEALQIAVSAADRYLTDCALPGKALKLLDSTGARLKLRSGGMPQDVIVQKKLVGELARKEDEAINQHEFEKARFFSAEKAKQKLALRLLFEKHKIDPDARATVQASDVEESIARWSDYPFTPPKS